MRRSAGFTLIELLAVTAIIVIISAVVLANNNRFGGAVILENFTYDVALSLRQAQVYGISVARFGTGTSQFDYAYGMHFDLSSPTTYILFADTVGSGVYSSAIQPTEVVATTDIRQGFFISDLCYTSTSQSEECNSANPGSVTTLDIVFKRPEPDAYIAVNGLATFTNGVPSASQPNRQARIVLKSPRGDVRSVIVDVAGQISVK